MKTFKHINTISEHLIKKFPNRFQLALYVSSKSKQLRYEDISVDGEQDQQVKPIIQSLINLVNTN
jgi:DNA-directed RNA polymerase subunit K/omega